MKDANQQSELKEFLELFGDARPKMFLKHWDRETFFNDGVQEVLMERHPSRLTYKGPNCSAWETYPIVAWGICEQKRLGTKQEDDTEFLSNEFYHEDPKWFARLTLAMIEAGEEISQRTRTPKTVLDKFVKWRNDFYLKETGFPCSKKASREVDETISKWPQIVSELNAMNVPAELQGSPPLPISEPEEAQKYDQAMAAVFGGKKVNPEQANSSIRQAIFKENKRRDSIMEMWAACWKLYFSQTVRHE